MDVIATTRWTVHWGGCNNAAGGLDGQLTKLRFRGVVIYVREAIERQVFGAVSSNQRVGMKRGRNSLANVLELCCPAELWQSAAEAVKAIDPHKRPVVRNSRFTARWAERTLKA